MPAGAAGGAASGGKHAIFLSYRRRDTGGYAVWVFEALEKRFGEGMVFFDKDSIHGGDRFSDVIKQSVTDCSAFIALISRDWLTVEDEQGRRRLDDPEDLVRRELALALQLGKKVVAVLFEVEADGIPTKETLPEPLQELAQTDYFHVRGKTFDYRTQFGELITLLASVPGVPPLQPAPGARTASIGVRPDKLPYLCDRSEQEPVVRETVRAHLRSRKQRPLVLVIHGRGNESHHAFADRLAAPELPGIAGVGLAEPIGLLHFRQPLNFSLGKDEFARELRAQIARQMQLGEPESDAALRDRIGEARLGTFAPVIKIYSEDRALGVESALRRFFEYWSDFPDSPRCLVACMLCVLYQGAAREGFLDRWRGRRADAVLRRAVARTADELGGAPGVTWKVLPELESVKFDDVALWARVEAVSNAIYSALRQEPTDTDLRATFGKREPIPMDDAIVKMRALLVERQGI